MNICLFEKNEIDSPLSFDDKRGEHILKVLHKKEGETFTSGIVGGASGTSLITKIDESARQIFFEFTESGDGKPLNPLKMIVGFPRPIQLRRLLRDVAALGISELHLTGTELGEKSYMQSDLAQPEKARELLLEGTVQAGSTHVPQVFVHKSLGDCLKALRQAQGPKSIVVPNPTVASKPTVVHEPVEGRRLICLDNVNPKCALCEIDFSDVLSKGESVVAAIGSERGWTDKERKLLEDTGFIRCGMGERIMRTETAVTVAGAIILNSIGIFAK